jgi:hypothetical protein
MAVNQCLKTLERPHDPSIRRCVVLAYLRRFRRTEGRAAFRGGGERFELGRSSISPGSPAQPRLRPCHIQGPAGVADSVLRPHRPATHWPVIRDGAPMTMQMRIRECLELMGAAPFAPGSEESPARVFPRLLSNGPPLKANVWRPAVSPPRRH